MARVYAAAEALFAQLEAELKKYQDWVVLGQPITVCFVRCSQLV